MCGLLGSVLELQELEIGLPQKAPPSVEEFNEAVTAHIGLGSHDQTQPEPAEPRSAVPGSGRKDRTRRPVQPPPKSKERTHKQTQRPDPDLPWAWTGREAPVGQLMHLAITDPKEFCALLQAALPRPTAWQRGVAARRAWEERQRAEQESRVAS
jgi:hypothetical protein